MSEETYILTTSSVEETMEMGRSLASFLKAGDVLVLTGDLGAGKTHLTKGIAAGLGILDQVTSPTFNLLLVYEGEDLPLYHFDLYRLDEAEELVDIDYAATLEGDGVCVVEWGDKFPEAMPVDYLACDLSLASGDARAVQFQAHGTRSQALLGDWMASRG